MTDERRQTFDRKVPEKRFSAVEAIQIVANVAEIAAVTVVTVNAIRKRCAKGDSAPKAGAKDE